MATSNSSGKSSSSEPETWEEMESGSRTWQDFNHAEQESIVRHYAPKVRYLALRLKGRLPKSVELNELISAGTLGLLEAFGKYQASHGVRFDTYAENRIRGAMLDELRRLDWFPRSLRQRVRKLDEVIQKFEHLQGRSPTEAELQEATGLDLQSVRDGLEALQNQLCLSLDAMQETFEPEIVESSNSDPARAASQLQLTEKVATLIDELTPREKMVLSLYYTEELNMRETAEVMGITEGRVSQLHSQALLRLRREFTGRYGMDLPFEER
jgi:RNA polymerase sigma factor for flagellar operon FliA